MGAGAGFTHLRVHSHYSLLASTVRVEALVRRAADLGMGAVALTDDGNLFGAVEFCREAREVGVTPILGCDLHVSAGSRTAPPEPGAPDSAGRLVALAENEAGWRNLVQLSSLGYTEGLHRDTPRVDHAALAERREGLIFLAGGPSGEIGLALRAGRGDVADAAAARLVEAVGRERLHVELVDHGSEEHRAVNEGLVSLARRLELPVVATNDVRFLDAGDFDALRALHCIGAGTTVDDPISLVYSPEQRFRTAAEMAAAFRAHPEALAATAEIAERCRHAVAPREPLLPHFAVPEGETLDSYFRSRVREGLDRRLAEQAQGPASRRSGLPRSSYDERAATELDVICGMGLAGYFLIVWDLIRFARERGIPVGPGRGSAAGSLVAWALGITGLDPLHHGLLFERFLNPERRSLPDIDMDFCQRRRGELIAYVHDTYGNDRVAQIITFGTLSARSVIRDVGRVMNVPYGEVDRIARLVPEVLDVTIDQALEDAPALAEAAASDARVQRLLGTARSLEGLARNAGVHAAGVIIAPQPITELAPLFRTGRHETTTQFAKDDAEWVGLLKMDFLGLKTLTVLEDAMGSIEREAGVRVRLEDLPLDDQETFRLFREARTLGIFQFESSGMRDVLRKLQPTTFDDLTALNALYRPGPLGSGMIDDYVARRHGRVKATFPHEALRPILEATHGVIVFQEQVMQAAVVMAGFTPGEADNLRKAMGKKLPEVMAGQREKFVKGAAARGTPERRAAEVFDLMAHFAGYGFNKSHSAAYALVAYWCAWLKAHHAAHFMAAMLTSESDHTPKVVRHVRECRDLGIEVLPPDVNASGVDFRAVSPTTIRFGLSAIKGVGRGAVESMLGARDRQGRFRSLHEFCAGIDLRLNNRKVLECLVKAGALDSVAPLATRASLFAGLADACESAQALRADRESGQASLFAPATGETEGAAPEAPSAPLPVLPEWTRKERLRHEKEVLGFHVSGHPLEEHRPALARLASAEIADLGDRAGQEVTVAGMVTALRRTRTKRGDWMAFVTIEDLTGQVEAILFPEAWKAAEAVTQPDAALCMTGAVEVDADRVKLLATSVTALARAEEQAASALVVTLPGTRSSRELEDMLGRIDDTIVASAGTCPLVFELPIDGVGRVVIEAGTRYRVTPHESLLHAVEGIVGSGRVRLDMR